MGADAGVAGGRAEALGVHSVDEEVAAELDVEGGIPAWLDGSPIRDGPGCFGLGWGRTPDGGTRPVTGDSPPDSFSE